MSTVNGSNMAHALSSIEKYLLPQTAAERNKEKGGAGVDLVPHERIDNILFQVALADHIRVMQTMFRDSNDDQNLGAELRIGSKMKLPVKHLMDKIVEGRSRSLALIRIIHGEDHLSMLKGLIDLASSYALQGMWPQVQEKVQQINQMLGKINRNIQSQAAENRRKNGITAAERIACTFRVIREHAIRNSGSVNKNVVKEVMGALMALPSHNEEEQMQQLAKETGLEHPSKFAAALHSFIVSGLSGNVRSINDLKKYSKSYFREADNSGMRQRRSDDEEGKDDIYTEQATKSWGEVLDYLRSDCAAMKAWMDTMNMYILPQHKAVLVLPFRQCDVQQRDIAHPIQLSQTISNFPSTARVLTGTKLSKRLSQIQVEVPLCIDTRTGSLQDLKKPNPSNTYSQRVFYELPVAVEEYLALYVLETDEETYENLFAFLKVQLQTIQGVCSIYTDQLETAEAQLKHALNGLEELGLEMEIGACELYNSIAQMMIMRHRRWIAGRKNRIKQDAEEWLDSADGKAEVKNQLKNLKKQLKGKSAPVSSGVGQAEMDLRARTNAMKKRITQLTGKDEAQSEESNKALEAANRYLVRSFEILETTHGQQHPSVGTACLAIASVQNIMQDYEETREWLKKALWYMEKNSPAPYRAISFTQIQLSQVLAKLGHEDEARKVLSKAAAFHMSRAGQMLLDHHNPALQSAHQSYQARYNSQENNNESDNIRPETARSNSSGTGRSKSRPNSGRTSKTRDQSQPRDDSGVNYSMVSPPIMKGSPLYEEINVALDVMTKVMRMSTKCYDKWQAAQQAEEIARLAENAFGWDSVEAAEGFKQVGIKCAAVRDWARSCRYFKQSLETHILLYGKLDYRTVNVAKLLNSARKSKAEDNARAEEQANAAALAGAAAAAAAPTSITENDNGFNSGSADYDGAAVDAVQSDDAGDYGMDDFD